MKKIPRKLRSRAGASMILALVFLLFTSFVGSTVLVSATANAYRVKHLSDQQEYLTERSTALLLSDELQMADDDRLQLNVIDRVQTVQQVEVEPNGSYHPVEDVDPVYQRVITFRVYTTQARITRFQRLMLETTINRYLTDHYTHAPTSPVTVSQNNTVVVLESFPIDARGERPSGLSEFMYSPTINAEGLAIGGSIEVTGSIQSGPVVELPTYTVNFSSGQGDDLYDFFLDFGNFSQLKVNMNAFYGLTITEDVKSPPRADGSGLVQQITTDVYQTVISWNDPIIEKGGAQDAA